MKTLFFSILALSFGCNNKTQHENTHPEPEDNVAQSAVSIVTAARLGVAKRQLAEESTMVASLNIEKDGTWKDLRVHDGKIIWKNESVSIEAKPQAVVMGQHEGKPALFIGFGQGKKFPEAATQIFRITDKSIDSVYSEKRARNMITDLHFDQGRIFMAAAQDDGSIASGWIENGAFNIIHREKLALRQLPLDKNTIAVGRVYGDKPKSDGDLKLIDTQTKKATKIETFRGIRALAKADINNDGIMDLLISDGWHYKYGDAARARVRLHLGPDFTDAMTLGDFPKDYTVNRIETRKTKSGAHLILANASRHAYLLQLTDMGWRKVEVCPIPEGGNAVFSKHEGQLQVICSGKRTQKVALQ